MMSRTAVPTVGCLVLFVLMAGMAASALANDEEDSTKLKEIVVTGTRIPAPNLESTSPIQVVTSQEIQATGMKDVSDIINQLPQVFNNDLGQDLGNRTSGISVAGGVATADLRGLGPNRTLVLVNGRRLGIGSPFTIIQSPAPDLDQIPTALIERVEVVTGGASAVYGSDAMAGVVNFILKKDFQGLQIDGSYGEYWHDNHNTVAQNAQRDNGDTPLTGTTFDGRNKSFNILMGANFDDGRGNVTAYFGYLKADPVTSGDRDFGGCQLAANDQLNGAVCAGSANSNLFWPQSGPNKDGFYNVSGNTFVDFGSVPTTPPAYFNPQRYVYITRGDERYNAGFMAHVDLHDYLKPYAEFSFMNDKTRTESAPTAAFLFSNPNDLLSNNYNINCSNPLLSAQEQAILCSPAQIAAAALNPDAPCPPLPDPIPFGYESPTCANVAIGRRNVEGGPRIADYEHTNYRAVLGSTGNFADAWSYDAYGQYYYTTFFNSNDRYFDFRAIDNALQVTTNANGDPVCISGSPCVPWNIFSEGGVTQDQLNYLYTVGTGYGKSTMTTIHADVTGQLGQYGLIVPTARDGVGVNLGFEHRNEQVYFQPDAGLASGQLSGFGSAATPIDNSVSVSEEFIEVRAPLIQDRVAAKELVFDTGYRRSHYSSTGSVGTYKFELQYAPTEDLRLRGSFQKAVRAPSVVELYNGALVGLIQYGNDPCSASRDANGVLQPAARSLADCLHTVPPAEQAAFIQRYGNGFDTNTIPPAILGQISQLSGGNPNLDNESSNSYSFGVTLTPRVVEGLTASIDYYRIKIDKEIDVIPPNIILNTCLDTGDPTFCSQIVRQHTTGSLTGTTIAGGGYIIQTNLNIGGAEVSGIDVQAAYKLELSPNWGKLAFALNGAYLQSKKKTPLAGEHTYDCAGLYGPTCQTVNPRWHHILRTTWTTPWDVELALTWRFIDSVKLDNNDSDPSLQDTVVWDPGIIGYNYFNARIPSFSYFDLSAAWNVSDNLELRAGINNMFDKDPPLATYEITAGGSANTYSTYDQLGRQLFISFTAKL